MDKVSESLLNEFSNEHEITELPEDQRFERFAAYITIHRHHAETFDVGDIITGGGDDTGIDAMALLVNGVLVTTVEELEELSGNLDATFVFIQAARSSGFDAGKIGDFGFGVLDFFKESPMMARNNKITEAAAIQSALYKRSSKFKPENPICRLYYVTTGKWVNDTALVARIDAAKTALADTGLFREVEFTPIDAAALQRLYRQSKNAISKEFNFVNKAVVPDMPGVKEAYLGFLPAKEFVKIIEGDDGEIISGLFYENVRDWLDSTPVNDGIRETLKSDARSRFVLMNNGITIIARNIQPTGNKIFIEDFSIVNGCQTSHVLFEGKDALDDSVMVPIRLIGTQDEDIINDIIRATNRQTEVKTEQFYALEDFSKNLETFCQAYPSHKLYYERRTQQYHRLSIEKTRIVTPMNMIKAYAAMFLEEPHRTTKDYAALKAKVGKEIFGPSQRMEPYYTAAYALYKLEFFFRNNRLSAKFKPTRFHILLAARLLANPGPVPRDNSNEMERYCKKILDILWQPALSDELIARAAQIVDSAAGSIFDRDAIRNEPFTKRVIAEIRLQSRLP